MTDIGGEDIVDDVVVTGQRRQADGSFPTRGGGAGGSGGVGIPGEQADEAGPGNPPPEQQQDPCADPETAVDWNTDAASAEALRRFQQDADDPLLDGRERHFVFERNPATGVVRLGNLAVGPAMGGIVMPDLRGINPAWIIGEAHSHPGSGPYPSGPDRDGFPVWQQIIADAGGDPSRFRSYIMGTRTEAGVQARLQIRVYDQNNLDGDEDNPGDEVNPDAQPCP